MKNESVWNWKHETYAPIYEFAVFGQHSTVYNIKNWINEVLGSLFYGSVTSSQNELNLVLRNMKDECLCQKEIRKLDIMKVSAFAVHPK